MVVENYHIEADDLSPYHNDADWLRELQEWARSINEANNNYHFDIQFKYWNGHNAPFP